MKTEQLCNNVKLKLYWLHPISLLITLRKLHEKNQMAKHDQIVALLYAQFIASPKLAVSLMPIFFEFAYRFGIEGIEGPLFTMLSIAKRYDRQAYKKGINELELLAQKTSKNSGESNVLFLDCASPNLFILTVLPSLSRKRLLSMVKSKSFVTNAKMSFGALVRAQGNGLSINMHSGGGGGVTVIPHAISTVIQIYRLMHFSVKNILHQLPSAVIANLIAIGLVKPTDIQGYVLGSLTDELDVVHGIDNETGTGSILQGNESEDDSDFILGGIGTASDENSNEAGSSPNSENSGSSNEANSGSNNDPDDDDDFGIDSNDSESTTDISCGYPDPLEDENGKPKFIGPSPFYPGEGGTDPNNPVNPVMINISGVIGLLANIANKAGLAPIVTEKAGENTFLIHG